MLDVCREVGNLPIKEAPGKIIDIMCPDIASLEDDIVVVGFEV